MLLMHEPGDNSTEVIQEDDGKELNQAARIER